MDEIDDRIFEAGFDDAIVSRSGDGKLQSNLVERPLATRIWLNQLLPR